MNLLAQRRTIILKSRILSNYINRKYQKITLRVYTEADFLIFLSVSIVTIMTIRCVNCIHMNAMKIYLHVRSGNNKLSPVLAFRIVLHVYHFLTEKTCSLIYTVNIAEWNYFTRMNSTRNKLLFN